MGTSPRVFSIQNPLNLRDNPNIKIETLVIHRSNIESNNVKTTPLMVEGEHTYESISEVVKSYLLPEEFICHIECTRHEHGKYPIWGAFISYPTQRPRAVTITKIRVYYPRGSIELKPNIRILSRIAGHDRFNFEEAIENLLPDGFHITELIEGFGAWENQFAIGVKLCNHSTILSGG